MFKKCLFAVRGKDCIVCECVCVSNLVYETSHETGDTMPRTGLSVTSIGSSITIVLNGILIHMNAS